MSSVLLFSQYLLPHHKLTDISCLFKRLSGDWGHGTGEGQRLGAWHERRPETGGMAGLIQ